MPVDAPEGTIARNVPTSVVRSTSTVGLPRESSTSRAVMLWMLLPPPRRRRASLPRTAAAEVVRAAPLCANIARAGARPAACVQKMVRMRQAHDAAQCGAVRCGAVGAGRHASWPARTKH